MGGCAWLLLEAAGLLCVVVVVKGAMPGLTKIKLWAHQRRVAVLCYAVL